jgi:integrase
MRHYERVLAPMLGLRVLRPRGKNHRSRRRVPLTGRALEALAQSPPRLGTTLLFPAPQGGYLALDNWRNRVWYPALEAAWITKHGPLPPAATVRDRGPRGRDLHVRAVAVDGHLDRDDRPPLRAPR